MTETVVTIDRNPSSGQPKATGTTNPNMAPRRGIQVNLGYFKTIPGIIKLVELILGILVMACASPAYTGATHYLLFVASTAFIATLLWSFAYLLSIREQFDLEINWILSETVHAGITTILYFIGMIVQFVAWSGFGSYPKGAANITAGVFALFNTLVYAAGAYLLFVYHKSGATK